MIIIMINNFLVCFGICEIQLYLNKCICMYILICMYVFDICEVFEVYIFWFKKFLLFVKNFLDKCLVLIKFNNNYIFVLLKYILFQIGIVYCIYVVFYVSFREVGGG